jgi:hypothetical protein
MEYNFKNKYGVIENIVSYHRLTVSKGMNPQQKGISYANGYMKTQHKVLDIYEPLVIGRDVSVLLNLFHEDINRNCRLSNSINKCFMATCKNLLINC